MDIVMVVLVYAVMILAAAGVILPFIPGVPLAWLALLGYGIYDHFHAVTVWATILFLILTVIVMVIEHLMPLIGAKKYNASKYGIIGAGIGVIVGPLVLSLPGIIIGPFAGAVIGELYAGRQEHALKAGFGVFMGFMAGMVIKFALVLSMVGYFTFALFKN